jgi:hypothetical protein
LTNCANGRTVGVKEGKPEMLDRSALTIGHVARLTDTSRDALRKGESRGRFPAPQRNRRGWREYDGETLRLLLEWRRSIGENRHDE